MKVLFLHSNTQDYLADSLFHGLRSVLEADCVDIPRYGILYETLTDEERAALRGRAFSLYGLLPELPELVNRRVKWKQEVAQYDLIIVANIWRQWKQLGGYALGPHWQRVVVLDGEDDPAFYPYAGRPLRAFSREFFAVRDRPYFKREWRDRGLQYRGVTRFLPQWIGRLLPSPRKGRRIAFSIPKGKLCDFRKLERTKDFPRHIVDRELIALLDNEGCSDRYVFDTETAYYGDLQRSRFGVTGKRAGWDCLRHYELAANGCVLCFRDLDAKPATCAPHGLDATNCISYSSVNQLLETIHSVTASQFGMLSAGTQRWIERNTTEARAKEFLQECAEIVEPLGCSRAKRRGLSCLGGHGR